MLRRLRHREAPLRAGWGTQATCFALSRLWRPIPTRLTRRWMPAWPSLRDPARSGWSSAPGDATRAWDKRLNEVYRG